MKKRKTDCPGGSAWQLFLNNHTVTVRALPVHGYAGMDCDAAEKRWRERKSIGWSQKQRKMNGSGKTLQALQEIWR